MEATSYDKQELYVPVTTDVIPEVYTPKWQVLEDSPSNDDFMEASVNNAVSCGGICQLIANLKPLKSINLNQAIELGLAVRLFKLMKVLLRDINDRQPYQQLSISRQIIDSASTLIYLLHDSGLGVHHRKYLEDSLVSERENYTTMEQTIAERGYAWDIEKDMMKRITLLAKEAGYDDIKSIPSRKKIGFPSAENRSKGLGDITYFAFRATSVGVHGTWSDVYQHHVRITENGWIPNNEEPGISPHAITSAVSIVGRTFKAYLDSLDNVQASGVFMPLLDQIIDNNDKIVALHEKALGRKQS